ncbi:hypothetical protein E4U43_008478 [Claviceps pusilla]|uniref:Uncharacterized protein n=1 Tax=Claviceps pusilla TaxID=123648 RepID=A0A9P7NBS4_9HYPO|nr:hypothetical protein E4U43_008478 [Claviceps pusilla]
MALLLDGNYDFLSALTLLSSKIDLSLPFEDEFHSRLLTQQHGFQDNYEYTFGATSPSRDYIQDMTTTDAHLTERTALSRTSSSGCDTSLNIRHCDDTTLSVPWSDEAMGKDLNLDDYHRGLLQVTGTDDRFFRPSFRRQNSEELQQQQMEKRQLQQEQEEQQLHQRQLQNQQQQQQQQEQQQQTQPQPRRDQQRGRKHHRKPVLQVCTTFGPKTGPHNVVRPSNRHIPQSAFNRESFWIDEDEGVTPRVTLTRYDLRADEQDIYAWKENPTFSEVAAHDPNCKEVSKARSRPKGLSTTKSLAYHGFSNLGNSHYGHV